MGTSVAMTMPLVLHVQLFLCLPGGSCRFDGEEAGITYWQYLPEPRMYFLVSPLVLVFPLAPFWSGRGKQSHSEGNTVSFSFPLGRLWRECNCNWNGTCIEEMTVCLLLICKSKWCWEILGATLMCCQNTETGSLCYKSYDAMTPVYIPGARCLCSDCAEGLSSETSLIAETLPVTIMSNDCSDPAPATPEIQEIANKVKPQFEQHSRRTYPTFFAVLYRSQAVVGTNYLIKVEVADGDYVHLLVFQAPPERKQGPELVQYWTGKTRDDPLEW
ncbi:uncharacterized protein [Phaenicophaeus curvirostris]|uniref:uncharacterized protein n=1 Tax=Phaenicophaeus curvirostris TaxID=33595 RepID=UPI0037F0D23D